MLTIERVFLPESCLSNAMNAAMDSRVTRKDMAGFYADCLRAAVRHGQGSLDWRRLNAVIVSRWPTGLNAIKNRAFAMLAPPVQKAAATARTRAKGPAVSPPTYRQLELPF